MKDLPDLTHSQRMAALMKQLSSVDCVADARKVLEQITREYGEAFGIYKMLAQRHGVKEEPPEAPFDSGAFMRGASERSGIATLGDLISSYATHPNSPVHKLRFHTRKTYEIHDRTISADFGDKKLFEMEAKDIDEFFQFWKKDGAEYMALAKTNALRRYFSFGASVLQDRECARLSAIMHNKRLKPASKRVQQLTRAQAERIIEEAHKWEFLGLALAMALQSDCRELHQKDIIGEWIPKNEPGPLSEFINEDGFRWVRGICCDQIDQNLILTHTKSWDGEQVVIDLKNAELVMKELRRQSRLPLSNTRVPFVTRTEKDGSEVPYSAQTFRYQFRKCADAAGVPREIRFMDARRRDPADATDDDEDSENGRAAEA